MATNGLNLQTSGLTFTTGEVVRNILTDLGLNGLGTLNPSAMLHVVPTGSTDSVRFEGLSSSSTETNYLVANANGVVETRNDVVTLDGTQTLTNKTINGSQLVDGSVSNAKLTNDDVTVTAGNGLTDGGSVALGSSVTVNVGAGTGISVAADTVGLDYLGTNNFIDSATDLEGTAIATADTIIYHDATDDNVKKGLVSDLPFTDNTGTVTSVAISGTDGIDVDSGSPITSSGTITLGLSNIPNSSLANSSITLAGDAGSNETVSLGDTLTVAGGTGLSSEISSSDTVTITLDNTAVGAGSYGSSSQVGTFTVDAQGRLTAASNVSIDGSAITNNNAFTTINVPTGQNPDANAYNDTLNLTSADGTLTISGNSTTDTIDFSVNLASVDSFVTGGTLNSPDGTLELRLNNGQSDVDITGFQFTLAGDSGSSTQYLGNTITIAGGTYTNTSESAGTVTIDLDTAATLFTVTADSGTNQPITPGNTLDIAGGTGLSSVVGATDTVTINLDNTAVTPNSYGSASETVTFTVDAQGRLTAASDVTIDITASQVNDFDTAAESAIFIDGNFVDSSNIDFTVTAGESVTADLTDTTVSAGNYGSSSQVAVFDVDAKGRLTAVSGETIDGSAIDNNTITFNGTTGSDPSIALNGTLNIISSDSSVVVSGGTGTIDITIDDTNIDNIYTANGTLTGNRTVTQDNNSLSFTGGDFSVDGTTFNVDDSQDSVGVGVSTPNASAVLEVASTTKGFLFPRMTETQRTGIGTPATGLMVYQTDGAEGIYIYKSFGWVQVI